MCGVCSVQIARLDPVQLQALGPRMAQEVRDEVRDGSLLTYGDYMRAHNTVSPERRTLLLE